MNFKLLLIGNRRLQTHRDLLSPYFILDNGLNPDVAKALAMCGLPIKSVQDEFGVGPRETILDPVIVNHIGDYYGFRGVWITKDMASKRQHIDLIKQRRISMIWIIKQQLTTAQQLRIVISGMARVTQDLVESDHPIHYVVNFHGQLNRERITYTVDWRP